MADPGENLREAKRGLRQELFARLRKLPESEKSNASRQIYKFIASRPEFQEAALVAGFVALPSEPDLVPLIRETLPNVHWCLPRVNAEGSIEMRRVSDLEALVTGDFNIREPAPEACPLILDQDIDLILLPGVGFDPANRARLGRGKGHYDRFLDRLRQLPSPPLVWGICFSGQLASIEPESHDQPVDAVVMENGFAT